VLKGVGVVELLIIGCVVLMFVALPALAVLLFRATGRAGRRRCPYCAEMIRKEASVCRFCGREVQPLEEGHS
jgi:hypothetical protein